MMNTNQIINLAAKLTVNMIGNAGNCRVEIRQSRATWHEIKGNGQDNVTVTILQDDEDGNGDFIIIRDEATIMLKDWREAVKIALTEIGNY